MGRNARRRHGELRTGNWNFSNGNSTVPIRTEQDFLAALTWLMEGGDDDSQAAQAK
jgi:hypothetical protein